MPTMQTELGSALEYFLEICPGKDERCRALYEGAIENGGLIATDFYTLRDWLEATKYEKHLSLHALLILLLLALDEGSLCLEQDEANFRHRLEDIVSRDDAQYWAARIVRDLARNDYSRLLGTSASAGTPLIRDRIQDRTFLFFQKYFRQERNFLDAFVQRLEAQTSSPASASVSLIQDILSEVLERRPLAPRGKPLVLDDDQLTALGLILLRPLVIVSGGPGTGKTSLVLTVLRCLSGCGVPPARIALAAPTGRAAQRLGDSIRAGIQTLGENTSASDQSLREITPSTLHQLLGYSPTTGRFRRHAESPIPADVVIVDEVSMVGLTLMGHLLHALRPETRLVLLGDKDQLPSVDAGAVLAHLLPVGVEPTFSKETVTQLKEWFPSVGVKATGDGLFDQSRLRDAAVLLRRNHRSEQRIQRAARAVNAGEGNVLAELKRWNVTEACGDSAWPELVKEGGCQFLECPAGSPRDLNQLLKRWARHTLQDAHTERGSFLDLVHRCRLNSADEYDAETQADLRDLFRLVEQNRLLTLVREGAWGCDGINRFLLRQLREMRPGRDLRTEPGSPVLITQNDPVRQLSNGDVGLTLWGHEDETRVVFERRGGFISFPYDVLPAREPGFALTVHKSQGSEYDHVLLLFPPEGARRLLTRELVYTAITRARRLALLFGKEEVIRHAIASRIEREAGWLRTLHGVG